MVEASAPSPLSPVEVAAAGSRHGALAFVGRRLLAGLVTLLIVSAITFLAVQSLPGNVSAIVLGRNATPEQIKKLDAQLHFDQPVWERYQHWLGGCIHGDLGDSSVGLAQGLPEPQDLGADLLTR